MQKIISFSYFLIFICLNIFSQNVDELINKLPSLSGKEKITTLSDICFYLSSENPEKAIAYGKQATHLSELTGDSLLYAYCLNDLSAAYYYNSQYDTAIYCALKAHRLFLNKNKKRDAGAALTKVANSYYEKSEFQKAIEYNEKALELFKSDNRPAEIGMTLNNIGSIYDKIGQLEFAKKMYLEAIKTADKYKDTNGYINAMGNYAIVLRKEDSLNKSLNVFLKITPLAERINNPERLSILYQNIGLLYKNIKQYTNALKYFNKANEISYRINDKSSLGINNINIGTTYLLLHEPSQAEKYIHKGLEISEQIKNKIWMKTGFWALYDLYKSKKDFERASLYLEKANNMEREIFKEDVKKQIAEFETKYKTLEKEAMITEQKNKLYANELSIQRKNQYIFYLISTVTGLIFLFILFYQRQRYKIKNAEIAHLKRIQEEKQRIARDLHDNLGSELTLVNTLIEIKSTHTDNVKDKKELDEISQKIRNASALMRDTIWATINEELTISQVGIRIKKFAEQLCQPKNIKVSYVANEKDVFLSPHLTLNLYRICQEIINNSVKYSQGKNININISVDKNIQINISDDGVGFDKNKISDSYGIKNIFSRAEQSNIKINLVTNINQGTLYTIEIPIQS